MDHSLVYPYRICKIRKKRTTLKKPWQPNTFNHTPFPLQLDSSLLGKRMVGLDPESNHGALSFPHLLRHFDVGLYRWLIRYVYIPLGGSQHGLFHKLISMAMTFSFVCLWHGCHDYLQCWALLNCVCVILENSITHFLCWPPLHSAIECSLSSSMRRRGLALISAFSTAMLILSNLFFLGGIHIGRVYWERVFMQGWSSIALPVLGCLYCFAQVGLEMDRKKT
ncbi:protein-cysteine N-palmitoyltransferase HHAT [Tachysurus ichikawai]